MVIMLTDKVVSNSSKKRLVTRQEMVKILWPVYDEIFDEVTDHLYGQ